MNPEQPDFATGRVYRQIANTSAIFNKFRETSKILDFFVEKQAALVLRRWSGGDRYVIIRLLLKSKNIW